MSEMILNFFTIVGVFAVAVAILTIIWIALEQNVIPHKDCPPCHGDCNQGRECPARRK